VKKAAARKVPAAKKIAAKKAAPAATAPVKKAAKRAAKGGVPGVRGTKKRAPAPSWVIPEGMTCPTSHPVKAKLTSRLFHLPGMFAYERTRPDRCYVDPATALQDGFTQAKR
jgi:hypothetical protein